MNRRINSMKEFWVDDFRPGCGYLGDPGMDVRWLLEKVDLQEQELQRLYPIEDAALRWLGPNPDAKTQQRYGMELGMALTSNPRPPKEGR